MEKTVMFNGIPFKQLPLQPSHSSNSSRITTFGDVDLGDNFCDGRGWKPRDNDIAHIFIAFNGDKNQEKHGKLLSNT
jgi:hypothetical protein